MLFPTFQREKVQPRLPGSAYNIAMTIGELGLTEDRPLIWTGCKPGYTLQRSTGVAYLAQTT